MTAKFISWILHGALCIILLATKSSSAVPLLPHVLQEVFEIASQSGKNEFRDRASVSVILNLD